MSLTSAGIITIPHSSGTKFDHGAFEPNSRRVFVAHTARDSIEVIDPDAGRHLATLDGFPEAAGVAAERRLHFGHESWRSKFGLAGCAYVTNARPS
jgi:hypothetical protein